MKNRVLLIGINAKYIHSNLAVRYLRNYCRNRFENISIAEFSINDRIDNMLRELYLADADIYAFSCYIWNIEIVLKICSSLKRAKPEAVIVVGGPEVSYDAPDMMLQNSFIDYTVFGEGEKTFLELLRYLEGENTEIQEITGLCWRNGAEAVMNPTRPLIPVLDEIPFPYGDFSEMSNKIVYYETSRGCPYSCQYCLSSTIHGVRFLSMERIRKDIDTFVQAGVKQVKLVDRTFNCNMPRSVEIMEYIIRCGTATNFHFEISADTLNDGFFETVNKAPQGLFQFEIGVQSTNINTLHEIKRKADLEKLMLSVERLMTMGNAHIHLDLIAGLPHEGFESFGNSFNDVYAMKPHMLQLGFLKLLKGSGLRDNAVKYDIEFHAFPPYEVIRTSSISYDELLWLKDVEHVLELYYNSGRFRKTLDFLLKKLELSPFDFYKSLSLYWNENGYFKGSRGMNEQYAILFDFINENFADRIDALGLKIFNEMLKLDWLLNFSSGSMPAPIRRYDHAEVKEALHKYIKDNISRNGAFSSFEGMTLKDALKYIRYEVFFIDILEEVYPLQDTVVFILENPLYPDHAPCFFGIPLSEINPQG